MGRGGVECGRSTRGVWYRLPAASGDLAISKGSRMPLRELDVTSQASLYLAGLSRETRRGAMALEWKEGGEARANWTPRIFTGHKGRPSLRGGSCTAPVATKAPHRRPSLSPLTLSPSLFPLADTPTPPSCSRWHRYAAIKSSSSPILRTVKPRKYVIRFEQLFEKLPSSFFLSRDTYFRTILRRKKEREEKMLDFFLDDR